MNQYFGQWFFATLDLALSDFNLHPLEVAEVKWIPKEELRTELRDRPERFIKAADVVFPQLLAYR